MNSASNSAMSAASSRLDQLRLDADARARRATKRRSAAASEGASSALGVAQDREVVAVGARGAAARWRRRSAARPARSRTRGGSRGCRSVAIGRTDASCHSPSLALEARAQQRHRELLVERARQRVVALREVAPEVDARARSVALSGAGCAGSAPRAPRRRAAPRGESRRSWSVSTVGSGRCPRAAASSDT